MPYLAEITYYQIFGKPLILYLGTLSAILLLMAVLFGVMATQGKSNIKMHLNFVKIAVAVSAVHFILGMLAYF